MDLQKEPAVQEVAREQKAPKLGSCLLVIFGASGDLTRRKLVPALYNLAAEGLLPERFAVIGFSRPKLPREATLKKVEELLREVVPDVEERVWDWLVKRLYYVNGDFQDPAAMPRLAKEIEDVGAKEGTGGNVLFYMATAPEFFGVIADQTAAAGLASEEGSWRRFVIEKPFGEDLESARALNARLLRVLREEQIYRIDHYLGKETVQNLLALRFGNGIFEPIWNRRYVDHVQVTVAETLGVEQRGGYYDQTGALRDMVPNHIFQLLSLTAMEPPVSMDADALRDEQAKVLRAIQACAPGDVETCAVRGQYGPGKVGGHSVPGYREEPDVAPDSPTETFAAMKLAIDNWRWNGVPFVFRTGKRLACHSTEIVIQFKRVPHVLFRSISAHHLPPNQLVVRIQPNEGIALSFQAKVPGQAFKVSTVDMNFRYQDYFGQRPSTGYERLLYDAMAGDATLFKRADMVEEGWRLVAPVQQAWKARRPRDFPNYPAGGWGPSEAEALLGASWRKWRECAGK